MLLNISATVDVSRTCVSSMLDEYRTRTTCKYAHVAVVVCVTRGPSAVVGPHDTFRWWPSCATWFQCNILSTCRSGGRVNRPSATCCSSRVCECTLKRLMSYVLTVASHRINCQRHHDKASKQARFLEYETSQISLYRILFSLSRGIITHKLPVRSYSMASRNNNEFSRSVTLQSGLVTNLSSVQTQVISPRSSIYKKTI